MFNKTQPAPAPKSAAPQPAAQQQGGQQQAAQQSAAPPRAAAVSSVIGKDVSITGDITSEGELQVDGAVKGQVRAGRLIVGESGYVEGEVRAQVAEIRGRVQGTVTARQVRLYGTANVDGDITHEQLAMEPGAFFQGRSVKYSRPAEGQAAQQAAPAAYVPPAPAAPAPFSGPAPAQPYPA